MTSTPTPAAIFARKAAHVNLRPRRFMAIS